MPGLRTRLELNWQKEREEQQRLIQETATLAKDLRQVRSLSGRPPPYSRLLRPCLKHIREMKAGRLILHLHILETVLVNIGPESHLSSNLVFEKKYEIHEEIKSREFQERCN